MKVGTPAAIDIIGADGSTWRVSGDGMGREGVELATSPQAIFDEAPISGIWQRSAFQEGATYLGHTIEPIDMILPFNIYGDGGDDWEYIESRFHAAWDEIEPTQIVVTTGGKRRSINVQKLENIQTKSDHDPRLLQWSVMTITVRAAWPFWIGDTIVSEASTTATNATLTVTVTNPTDRPMWLQWALTAPGSWVLPDFSWKPNAYAAKTISVPKLAVGENLTIDTHPLNEPYVAANGANIAGRFGGVLFQHSVPPHTPPTNVPVKLINTPGGGAVQLRMRQEWKRAWRGERNVSGS